MRTTHRPSIGRLALGTLAALVLATTAVAGPAVAKEGMGAQLEAPIARDTPGGSTLVVRMFVFVNEGEVNHPVRGTPVYLELVGRDGTVSRVIGTDTGAGQYTMRIVVPASGIAAVEVGIAGTTDVLDDDRYGDLPIHVAGQELVPGPVTGSTAQVAPVVRVASTPFPAASAVPPPAVAPATTSTAAPVAAAAVTPPLLLAGLLVLVAVVALAAAAIHRTRSSARLRVTGDAPEA